MAVNNPYQTYQKNSFSTASPGELTLMLYNGCLKFITTARVAIQENDISEKNTNLIKAQNIIQELMVTLNMENEISKQMIVMYDYIKSLLIEANINNDLQILEEAEGYVTEFRDTWKQVIQVNRQKQYQGGQV
ncbi:flagellar export chaperone FliS [Bacillus sp. JJ1533]|uniref:flagellar export chaperone FliS n=1 Tax=Bacillus sp. JJ1533 TaxID=3122959 RepID=UPI002FFE5851